MSAFVGIDVAKASLAVAVVPGNQRLEVGNNPKGHGQLVRWLARQPVSRILLESTGGYENALVQVLASRWPVVRVPPHRARALRGPSEALPGMPAAGARALEPGAQVTSVDHGPQRIARPARGRPRLDVAGHEVLGAGAALR